MSFHAVPEGEYGVRCVPWTARERASELATAPMGAIQKPGPAHPLCPGCGLLTAGVNPCPRQFSPQDAMLLGAAKLGLELDVEVPDDSTRMQDTIDEIASRRPVLWTPGSAPV